VFEVLVASNADAREPRAWPAKLASAALHAGLVALAAVGTYRDPAVVRPACACSRVVVSWPTTPVTHPEPGAPRPLVAPRPALPVFTIPTTIPPIAPLPPGTTVPDLPGFIPGPPLFGRDTGFVGMSGIPGIVDEREADEPPVLLSHPAPQYPAVLRQAGIEGRVLVEAVLDADGRVERESLRVVSSAHRLFAAEAERVVLASRYRPARVAGRAVRVRVAVPVNFALTR